MSDPKFIPPQQNPLLVRLAQSIFYLVTYLAFKFSLIVSEEDLAKVRAIACDRVVYLPNHSNLDDGVAVFQLSARIGQLFHYVVAIEAFQGVVGKLIQLVGAYSLRRGVGDRSSVIQTLTILQQPQCKLVIFPEGGCSYQNDTVIPFRTGAIELSFKALEKLVKQENTVPDFYLVPVSLKYCYPKATNKQIDQALTRLEHALALKAIQDDRYSRLRAIAEKVLTSLETEYHVAVEQTDWNQRCQNLRKQMLGYCEAKLAIATKNQLGDREANRERVYRVQSILRNLSDPDQKAAIDYEHLYLTTVRLLNFDAIYDGYVAEKPTIERYFATIDRLEREVFKIDRPKFKGWREITAKIGTPINLKNYWQKYHSDRPSTSREQIINHLTEIAQQEVQANLS
ncbi:MAG: 1-acyl-sn-glycerol-3-phosphate acyltransferase [Pleurocapsa minor HA4230-MV1]|jgi:1-acyl-sn-glycerol-3-phosphate acyltransferase|nr:1-acyl-sn-glycerol-3-phosphate acyltransferase [Pleurocapsa minor HA4230-MV1]